ncbi:MAG: class II fructose-bisphosphatase [Deltaproteobacteria bacterium]|nr:class II fructose-bisphosphatase [Deltaproteobacteria bacterium]
MDRNLALELVRVTEAAALSCARWMGKGNKHSADEAATEAMRHTLQSISFMGRVVIGEGEMDEAPMLYIGEIVGNGSSGMKVDIAVDPLEGTNLCAMGMPNSIATIAAANEGCFLHAPDMYMDKICVGAAAKGAIDIMKPPAVNVRNVADALGLYPDDMTVVILDRDRHRALIDEVRSTGARIKLIPDGDVAPAVAAGLPDAPVDMLIGVGGGPEGVLAAAALKCLGGDMQARLYFTNEEEKRRCREMGIGDLDRVFYMEDLAKGDVLFAATGVTDGDLLEGVKFRKGGARTNSIVMRSFSRTIRYIQADHYFDHKPVY